MPIDLDIRDHPIIGPMIQKAEREGLKEGQQKGRQEGELTILRRQITRRFGTLPAWADERLAKSSTAELEELSERLLDAQRLEDLLGPK